MDLMPKVFIESFKNWETVYPASNKKVKMQSVDSDAGFKTLHCHVKMPGVVINRSFFVTEYHIEGEEPGEYQFIMSGRGNEDYARRHENLTAKMIVAMMHINYIGIKPLIDDDGEVIGSIVSQV